MVKTPAELFAVVLADFARMRTAYRALNSAFPDPLPSPASPTLFNPFLSVQTGNSHLITGQSPDNILSSMKAFIILHMVLMTT